MFIQRLRGDKSTNPVPRTRRSVPSVYVRYMSQEEQESLSWAARCASSCNPTRGGASHLSDRAVVAAGVAPAPETASPHRGSGQNHAASQAPGCACSWSSTWNLGPAAHQGDVGSWFRLPMARMADGIAAGRHGRCRSRALCHLHLPLPLKCRDWPWATCIASPSCPGLQVLATACGSTAVPSPPGSTPRTAVYVSP